MCNHEQYNDKCNYCKLVMDMLCFADGEGCQSPDQEDWKTCKHYYERCCTITPDDYFETIN